MITPTFWQMAQAAITGIRYQGILIAAHAVFPVAGLLMLMSPLVIGRNLRFSDALVAFMSLFFTPLITLISVWIARRNKLAQGPLTYSFDSEGVHIAGNAFNQTFKWAAIPRVRESKRFLFIFISRTQAFAVPIAALKDQGVLEEVVRVASQNSHFR